MINLPTRQQIYDGIITALEAEFDTNLSSIGKVFLRGFAAVQAAKLWLIYKAIGNAQKNIFPDTADSEVVGGTLERFGRLKLGRNPYGAIAGQYTAVVSGTVGGVIPANTLFKSDDTATNAGMLFVVDNDFTYTGSNLLVIRALTAGLESKLNTSDKLTVTNPLAQFDSKITIATQIVQPQAAEDLELYRQKVIASFRLLPQGGAATDYRVWASEVQGVANSYPYLKPSAVNEVNLFIEATAADSSDGKGTPTTTIINNVTASIEATTTERPERKPITVKVNYLPISVKEIDINISSFTGITNDMKTAIFNAVKADFDKVRPFVGSIDPLSEKNDRIDSNRIVSTVLSVLPGSAFGAVTIKVNNSPVSSFTFENGDIPNLNQITYV